MAKILGKLKWNRVVLRKKRQKYICACVTLFCSGGECHVTLKLILKFSDQHKKPFSILINSNEISNQIESHCSYLTTKRNFLSRCVIKIIRTTEHYGSMLRNVMQHKLIYWRQQIKTKSFSILNGVIVEEILIRNLICIESNRSVALWIN